MYLKNKKVLFIAPHFYDYHLSIKNELESNGASVDYYEERPNTIKYKIYKKLSKKLKSIEEKKYFDNILNNIKTEYDIFYLIRGEVISKSFLEKLKNRLPKAKFVMYQWDSVQNNNYIDKIHFFDKVFTFDMIDAKKYKINYLPLFYTKEYENLQHNKIKQYDIVFVGYYHSDRLNIVKKMANYSNDNNLKFKYHIYLDKLVLLKFILQGNILFSDLKYISTKSLSKNNIIDLYKDTKAVLDIQHNMQNGLTMRTMEVLGSGLKLITTNQNIKNEDFYDENNICLIDRVEIVIKKAFFNKLIIGNLSQYRLFNWLWNVSNVS
jgi:hypothetical protein